MSTIQRYVQSDFREKQLIAFFAEYFNESTTCIKFQFHDPKSEESCFVISICQTVLFKERSTKEAGTMPPFVERLKKIHENIIT